MFNPTPQQAALRNAILNDTRSIELNAKAGSGKTTTVLWATQFMEGRAIVMAYNKKIATELQSRIRPEDLGRVEASTFHSAGMRLWKQVAKRAVVDERKVEKLAPTVEFGKEAVRKLTIKLVSLAKQSMFTPETERALWDAIIERHNLETDQEQRPDVDQAREILIASTAMGPQVIDFDDMIYLPVLNGLSSGSHDWVCIDEAQDTNAARRGLALMMMKPRTGRLVAVGDPHQAIYGFTGADYDAMDLIADELGSLRLPLSVSFRCPKSVIALAQQIVPDIESAPNAPDGVVDEMTEQDFLQLKEYDPASVLLCRTTKPLVAIAYNLLSRNIPCTIEGRDIGNQLIALTRKVIRRTGFTTPTVDNFLVRLDLYQQQRTEKLMRDEDEQGVERLNDQCDALRVIADQYDAESSAQVIVSALDNLFTDKELRAKPIFTLSTVHKAKGREWDHVYLLGRNAYMPSRWAKQDWQKQQEQNLIYVALTRAKQRLTEVHV
jgi:DNA helicase-2/ATP-dependent DNA helicase PcrA